MGNLKTASGWNGSRSYGYNGLNLLNSLTNASVTTGYAYNGLNQRVQKSGSVAYNYVYAPGGALLGETANGGTSLTTEYIWAGGAPIGLIRNGTLYYIHDDHLGRPDTVTNASGGIAWQAQNTAFDRTITTDSIGGFNIGFPGQYYDSESGLYYNGARYYDPTMGRYIQADPFGLLAGPNRYVYARNMPTTYVDRTGEFPEPFEVGAGIVAGAIGGYIAGGTRGAIIGGIAGGVTAAVLSPVLSEEAGASAYALFRARALLMTASNVGGQALANGTCNGQNPVQAFANVNLPLAVSVGVGGAGFGTAAEIAGGSSVTADAFGEMMGGVFEHDLEPGGE